MSALSTELLLFALATFTGALVAGVAGFAFGVIASAIWLHVITPAQSAALIAAYAIIIQAVTLWQLRHAIKLSRLLPLVIGGAIGIPLGTAVLRWATPDQMRGFIGAALILFALYGLARPNLPSVTGGPVAEGV